MLVAGQYRDRVYTHTRRVFEQVELAERPLLCPALYRCAQQSRLVKKSQTPPKPQTQSPVDGHNLQRSTCSNDAAEVWYYLSVSCNQKNTPQHHKQHGHPYRSPNRAGSFRA